MKKYFTDKQLKRMEKRKKNVRPPPQPPGLEQWVWARAVEKRTSIELIGRLCLDIDSPQFGELIVEFPFVGIGGIITTYSSDSLETPTPLTKKEIFKYKMAGKI